jgi:hypothetical protein
MDSVFLAIFSWQFLLFCLGIAGVTFVIRKLVEYFVLDNPKMPGNKASKLWRELLLPIGPVVGGALLGLVAAKYPYPEGINSISGRVIFGLVAGLLSGLVYRVMTGMLKKTTEAASNVVNNVEAPPASPLPPPTTGVDGDK